MSQSEGEAVGKDEVRVLSRSNLERRIEELKQDSQIDEQDVLIAGIYVLRAFCLGKKTNVFLVPEQLRLDQVGRDGGAVEGDEGPLAPLALLMQTQGDQLRVSGKKRDDLQEVIAKCKAEDFGIPLQFTNFRD